MESLGIQARPAPYLQPAHALQGEVAAVLREGRVLAGEVLQKLDGGSLLIGIGGDFRVIANSRAELQPGDRFLFEVERRSSGEARAGELVLRVLEGETREPLLLRTLRSRAPGAPIDLGRALEQLSQTLRASGSSGEALLSALGGGSYSAEQAAAQAPSDAAAAIRAALAFGGAQHEAGLLSASLAQVPVEALPTAVAALLLERALGGDADLLSTAANRAVVQPAAADLRAALSLARLDSLDLNSVLRTAAEQVRSRPVPNAAAATLRSQLANGLEKLASGGNAALVKSLRRPAAGSSSAGKSGLEGATTNRKALLFQALQAAEGESELTPSAREAVARTLRALESEQLQSVLRREVGAAQRFSLPFFAENELRSAKLWVEHDASGSSSEGSASAAEGRTRATVALELSVLGSVRVDILLHGERVALRALVSNEDAAVSLRAGFEALRVRLEAGGHTLLGGGVSVERDPARLRADDLDHGAEKLDLVRSLPATSSLLDTVG